MPIQYENIYSTFTSLPNQERLLIINEIRRKRREYATPKRKQSTSKKEHSKKETKKDKFQTLIGQLSSSEREALLKELDNDS